MFYLIILCYSGLPEFFFNNAMLFRVARVFFDNAMLFRVARVFYLKVLSYSELAECKVALLLGVTMFFFFIGRLFFRKELKA